MSDEKDFEDEYDPSLDPFYHDPTMFHNPYMDPFMGNYLSVDIPDWKHEGNNEIEYPLDAEATRKMIIENLQLVYDPEIPINIYDIGLIYTVDVDTEGNATLVMTLTTPNCPSAQELPEVAQLAVNVVPGVKHIDFELTFEPPWHPSKMNEEAKLLMMAEYGMDMDQM